MYLKEVTWLANDIDNIPRASSPGCPPVRQPYANKVLSPGGDPVEGYTQDDSSWVAFYVLLFPKLASKIIALLNGGRQCSPSAALSLLLKAHPIEFFLLCSVSNRTAYQAHCPRRFPVGETNIPFLSVASVFKAFSCNTLLNCTSEGTFHVPKGSWPPSPLSSPLVQTGEQVRSVWGSGGISSALYEAVYVRIIL